MENNIKRAIYMLMVANNLLNKQNKSPYVLDLLSEEINYDGTECDGNCIMEDIQAILSEFGIEPDENSTNGADYIIPENCLDISIV